MNPFKRLFSYKAFAVAGFLLGGIAFSSVNAQVTPPKPYGLTPTSKQIEWYHRERMVYCHFGPNTFDGQEQGYTTDPNVFKPRKIDCGQWARFYKRAGFTTAFLTTKHADGFCLWQTDYSTFSVKQDNSWMGGKGDVCKMFTDSMRAYGIKPAFYLSPTCNYGPYGSPDSPKYIDQFTHFLGELLSNYGPITEIWWDGYRAEVIPDAAYKRWTDTIHQLQPNCTIFQTKHAAGMGDVRWVGNEIGLAGDPCWSTTLKNDIYVEVGALLNAGNFPGDLYAPAESEESIRPNGDWFWHPGCKTMSVTNLWNMFFTTVGRNTVQLLNIPPDTNGLITKDDSLAACAYNEWEYGTFRKNLLQGATATALHTRGSDYDPVQIIDTAYWEYTQDTSYTQYFASDDQHKTDTITFTTPSAITFDCAMMEEVIGLGQRTTDWAIDANYSGGWHRLVTKKGIGGKRAVQFSQVTSNQVRLCILAGVACPAIHSFGVYKQAQVPLPENWPPPFKKKDPSEVKHPSSVSAMNTESIMRIVGDKIMLPAGFGAGAVTVSIVDLHGRCVKQITTQRNDSRKQLTIPSLKPGSYLVRCSNGTTTLEQKFTSAR